MLCEPYGNLVCGLACPSVLAHTRQLITEYTQANRLIVDNWMLSNRLRSIVVTTNQSPMETFSFRKNGRKRSIICTAMMQYTDDLFTMHTLVFRMHLPKRLLTHLKRVGLVYSMHWHVDFFYFFVDIYLFNPVTDGW